MKYQLDFDELENCVDEIILTLNEITKVPMVDFVNWEKDWNDYL